MKYQELSTNVSIVSVSRSACPPHFGQLVLSQLSAVSKGFPGALKDTSSGNLTGKRSFFSGTIPHLLQCITGIGQPQYLCREIPQSFNL